MMVINMSLVNSTLFSIDRDRRLKISVDRKQSIRVNVVFLSWNIQNNQTSKTLATIV